MNDFIEMPEEVSIFNGQFDRCDMLAGPCCCGAWHNVKDSLETIGEIKDMPLTFIQNLKNKYL